MHHHGLPPSIRSTRSRSLSAAGFFIASSLKDKRSLVISLASNSTTPAPKTDMVFLSFVTAEVTAVVGGSVN
jgi:hypothetical protein